MRLLHFSWEYPPVMYGGLGAHVLALTQAQARHGHDVTVITQAPAGETGSSEECKGVRVIRVANHHPDAQLVQENFDYWVHGFALASQNACESLEDVPEIVHGHDWIAASQLAVAAKKFAVPSVLTVHATEFGRHNGWLTSRLSQMVFGNERRAINTADSVIVCSNYMMNEVRNGYGVEPTFLNVVPNAVASSSQVLRREEIISPKIVVGYIGRLEWEKGVHHLIDALGSLNNSRIHLEIVGTGSQLLDLKEKVSRKGLSDQISFLGYVDDNDRPGILQSWTLAVIPSSYEPFGIVALELAQVGIPIIAAQVGGLADIISSPNFGYPIPEVSGDTIAREIDLILSNPEQAGERATRLRERVAIEFTWERVVDLTDLIYEKIRS